MTQEFVDFKTSQIEKLVSAIFEGEVDQEIIPYLSRINLLKNFVTTWSCIGHERDLDNGGAYLSVCSSLSSEVILNAYHKIAYNLINNSTAESCFDYPFRLEVGFSEKNFITYVFRFLLNFSEYNPTFVHKQIHNITEFLSDLDSKNSK